MDRPETVRVRDVMTSPVHTVSPSATVQEAAKRMHDRDISALLVTSSPVGIITSTDVLAGVAEGLDLASTSVADAMTPDVETVTPDLYLEEAAAMMTTYGIKHLPVVDDDYVGMVSTMDVAAQLS
jgi:CBS domain-containing protein